MRHNWHPQFLVPGDDQYCWLQFFTFLGLSSRSAKPGARGSLLGAGGCGPVEARDEDPAAPRPEHFEGIQLGPLLSCGKLAMENGRK